MREKYDDDIPPNVEELCSLPGVGKKMAYLCMDVAWGKVEGIGKRYYVFLKVNLQHLPRNLYFNLPKLKSAGKKKLIT